MYGQPVALNGKLYVRGWSLSRRTDTVLEYTPDHDKWTEPPPPPDLEYFAIATLRGKLVVGGKGKYTGKNTNTILTFDDHSQQWIQSHPVMATALI